MNRYLVISYDPDEQQWFYDSVCESSESAAKEWILKMRPYAVDADVLTVTELGVIAETLVHRTQTSILEGMAALSTQHAEES